MPLLVATSNPGKAREYRELLRPLATDIVCSCDTGLALEVTEDGASYRDNALKKATAYCAASGLVTVADDSGLEVDALEGAPGIRSARYAVGSDADRVAHLLSELAGAPWEQRSARFRCVLAIVNPYGPDHCTVGVCEGMIALSPSGTGGFGYDPIFFLPRLGCSMAELEPELKNRISHRARAVAAALPILTVLLDRPPGSPT